MQCYKCRRTRTHKEILLRIRYYGLFTAMKYCNRRVLGQRLDRKCPYETLVQYMCDDHWRSQEFSVAFNKKSTKYHYHLSVNYYQLFFL